MKSSSSRGFHLCRQDMAPILFVFSFFVSILRAQGGDAQTAYVFGDSLFDVGNNNFLDHTMHKANFPYNGIDFPGRVPTGRFSNGYNIIDYIAHRLGYSQSPPSYLSMKSEEEMMHGANFASGGSGILDSTGTDITLTAQVLNFKHVVNVLVKRLGKDAAAQELAKSIYLISAGSNDIFTRSQSDSMPNDRFIASLVTQYENHLKEIYNLGGRKFVILGTGLVGCVPYLKSSNPSGNCIDKLNNLSKEFRKLLIDRLNSLSSTWRGFKYAYADGYNVGLDVIADPSKYGFKETQSACCGSGRLNGGGPCIPNATYCGSRGEFVFWDSFHPTQAYSNLNAQLAYAGSQRYATPVNIKQLVSL